MCVCLCVWMGFYWPYIYPSCHPTISVKKHCKKYKALYPFYIHNQTSDRRNTAAFTQALWHQYQLTAINAEFYQNLNRYLQQNCEMWSLPEAGDGSSRRWSARSITCNHFNNNLVQILTKYNTKHRFYEKGKSCTSLPTQMYSKSYIITTVTC